MKRTETVEVEYVAEPRSVVLFSSNLSPPFNLLSNLARVEEGIEIGGVRYPSVEHAYQSLKFPRDQKHLLACHGQFGDFQILIESDLFYPRLTKEERAKKMEYWSKKDNIGIIAKMVTDPTVMAKLGMTPVEFKRTDETWHHLLQQKFAIERFRNVLLPLIPIPTKTKNPFVSTHYTGKESLVEFQRSANHSPCFFGALVDAENGNVYGKNYMGRMLMEVRSMLVAVVEK
jgi:predicted NAD-dependent protein-ADP-ribosyltransferase YbiA (DUF1768 family)